MRSILAKSLPLLLLIIYAAGPSWAADTIQWASSLAEAQKLATQSNRLLLLHFGTANCPPCRALERNVFPQARIGMAVNQNFVAVKIDAEASLEVARHFGVRQWPTDVITTPNGQVLHRTVSPQDAEAYLAELGQALARWNASRSDAASLQAAARGPAPVQIAPHTGAPAPNLNAPPPEFAPVAYEAGATSANGYNPQGYAPPAYDPRAAAPSAQYQAQQPPAYGAPYQQPAPQQVTNPYIQGYPPQGAPAYGGNTAAPPAAAGYNAPNWPAPVDVATAPAAPPAFQPNPNSAPPAAQPWPTAPPGYSQPPAAPQFNAGASFNAPPPAGPQYHVAQREPAPAASTVAAPPAAVAPPPAQPPVAPQAAPQAAPQTPPGSPPLALDGFCPVSLAKHDKWVRGDVKWGAIHRGNTYLFASEAEQKEFLANPDKFSPILGGCDVVKLAEQGVYVPGRRKFGVRCGKESDAYGRQLYLFSDEDAVQRFWANPKHYAEIVRQAMAGMQAGGPVQR